MSDPRGFTQSIPASIPDPPKKWRCREGEDEAKWNLACEEKIRPGGLIDGRGASFITDPPFTLVPIVGENVAERTGAARLGRAPCNYSDARIFASRVAVARVSLHAH